MVLILIIFLLDAVFIVAVVELLKVFVVAVLVIVTADESAVGWYNSAILDDNLRGY